jgi:hypothetical protein
VFATFSEDGRADLEIRIRGVRIFEGGAGCGEHLFLLVGGEGYGHFFDPFLECWKCWNGDSAQRNSKPRRLKPDRF